jgi:hypothetical protein
MVSRKSRDIFVAALNLILRGEKFWIALLCRIGKCFSADTF